jgi:hypothetical protein
MRRLPKSVYPKYFGNIPPILGVYPKLYFGRERVKSNQFQATNTYEESNVTSKYPKYLNTYPILLAGGVKMEYPPYVDAYGQLKELFAKIKEASVPPKFTQEFLSTVLSLKSSSYRPMIPFLKRMGFIDQANVPTKAYSEYRDESKSKAIMAQQIRSAYSKLYTAHTYAHKLKKEEIMSKLTSVLGTSKEDKTIPKVAATFLELCKLADFEAEIQTTPAAEQKESISIGETTPSTVSTKLGISYTINLNLPATTDIEVFNST